MTQFFDFNWKSQIWNLIFLVGAILGGFITNQFLSTSEAILLSEATLLDLSKMKFSAPTSVQPDEILGDAKLETRARDLSTGFRCLVCQNQTIADSNADLAVDLKNQVRKQLSEGRSKEEILKYMTDRYGDFVLYKPPFNAATIMLWVGPFLLMLFGLFFLVRQIKQRRQDLLGESFSPQDIERARQLLDRKTEN